MGVVRNVQSILPEVLRLGEEETYIRLKKKKTFSVIKRNQRKVEAIQQICTYIIYRIYISAN